MSTIEIACCGMFHQVTSLPWTCKTCGQVHLGASPPTFLYRVQVYLEELDADIRLLQEEIVARKHTIRHYEEEQAALLAYLALRETHSKREDDR